MKFIDLFRSTADKEMVRIFTCGGCYKFHLILKEVFPDAIPYKVKNSDGVMHHVLTKIDEHYFDIIGGYSVDELQDCSYEPMNAEDIKLAEEFTYPVVQEKEKKIKSNIESRNYKIKHWINNVCKYAIYTLVLMILFDIMYSGFYNKNKSIYEFINMLMMVLLFFGVIRIFGIIMLLDFDIHNYCPYCGERIKKDYIEYHVEKHRKLLMIKSKD